MFNSNNADKQKAESQALYDLKKNSREKEKSPGLYMTIAEQKRRAIELFIKVVDIIDNKFSAQDKKALSEIGRKLSEYGMKFVPEFKSSQISEKREPSAEKAKEGRGI